MIEYTYALELESVIQGKLEQQGAPLLKNMILVGPFNVECIWRCSGSYPMSNEIRADSPNRIPRTIVDRNSTFSNPRRL